MLDSFSLQPDGSSSAHSKARTGPDSKKWRRLASQSKGVAHNEQMHGILFDMDGVLYDADRPISGAAETVAWAKHHSIPYLFVTNTTSRDRAALVDKLRGFGIEASEQEIMTPAVAVVQWLRQQGCNGPLALFLPPSVKHEFAGMPCLGDDVEKGPTAYVVIGDLQNRWDYRTLNRAFRLLYFNPEAKLIALGMTRYWLASDGISLDVGPFVAALENATGRQPIVFGKPAKGFFLERCRAARAGAGRCSDGWR
jgi:HAD superfamily hydrolase (TIGR01458 family)